MAYRLVTNLVIYDELNPTFPGSRIFPQRISHTLFVRAWQNLAALRIWQIKTYSLNLVNFLVGGSVIPCGNMHQYFAGAVVKWLFNNFRLFADSLDFSIRCPSIRCKLPVHVPRRMVISCNSTSFLFYHAMLC